MAYEIHIRRTNDQPISLEEWVKTVDNSENVRLGDAVPIVLTNPTTGEQISNPQLQGVAELYDVGSQVWFPAFRWFEGRITTRASRDFDTFHSHQRSVMRALASQLGAQIVGDEGESYD
ncbi:hypothetical protein [uncultured Pseudosulfitobacter sp.]|jgi:hypothetical protein|uniref:hypothetical protein n=1 Tax=uncultured Pseudosulfitobacter sp. TaxID=2854214 RepID=UPI0030D872A9|tara:strand:+ start:323 stop:679 length:357 start_codon:yes stop_codon:yes gene_type:complete